MGARLARKALCSALMVIVALAPGEGAENNFDLQAPIPDADSVFGALVLPQLFPGSQARTLSEACAVLAFVLEREDEQESLPGACTGSNARLFAQVRGQDSAFRSVRFKLNSETDRAAQDLLELTRVVEKFHDAIGWHRPQAFLDQLVVGMARSCRSSALEYEFVPERGTVPRFNLTIRMSASPTRSPDEFWIAPMICRTGHR